MCLVSVVGARMGLSLMTWLELVLAVDLGMQAWTVYARSVMVGLSLLLTHHRARCVVLVTTMSWVWLSAKGVGTARRW